MSDVLYAIVIFLLKLALVIVFSPLIGCVGLATVPLRYWQVSTGRLKAQAAKLESSARLSVIAGTVVIFIAAIGWLASIAEIVQTVTCSGAGCALAGLGVFFVLSAFGCVYGLAELLLFPVTFSAYSNE